MLAYSIKEINNKSDWFIDSGASSHMTCQRDLFDELIEFKNYELVKQLRIIRL